MDSICRQKAGNAYKLRIFRLFWFLSIGFGCQKVVFNFGSVKLHKTELVLFRCPKIRKTKYA
ncbi:MAG TPA: hypothetical protein DCS73_01345 [Roseburia sp.]|nr:hypothetical protein [Roseburia sp.]